ncbi:hypothetical protein AMP9_2747 [plant metagenome]|uniref:Uncharacterized protein n=1 Tax=plant metagenome TaxID=1297885 RepID=A0A484Q4E2_9ZZZZ
MVVQCQLREVLVHEACQARVVAKIGASRQGRIARAQRSRLFEQKRI